MTELGRTPRRPAAGSPGVGRPQRGLPPGRRPVGGADRGGLTAKPRIWAGPRGPPPTPPRSGCGWTPRRVGAMAAGLRSVAALPTRSGRSSTGGCAPTVCGWSGCGSPLGVVGINLENRPNVTSDAAGLCLKAGDGRLLRGSSSAPLLEPGHRRLPTRRTGQGRAAGRRRHAGRGHQPGLGGLVVARGLHRLPDPGAARPPAGLGARARHRPLRGRRGRGTATSTWPGRRPGHGRGDRGERQDPAPGGLQQRPSGAGPPGGGRGLFLRLSAALAGVILRGDAGTRASLPTRPGRPTRTSPPSSSTSAVGGGGRRPRRGHRPHRPVHFGALRGRRPRRPGHGQPVHHRGGHRHGVW